MAAIWLASGDDAAAAYKVGPKVCAECHENEVAVWEKTQHFKSFKEIRKKDKAKTIATAVGGKKDMRKNPTCSLCHFSLVQKDESAKPSAKASTSCESCHGDASDWLYIHNDFGGKNVKREDESAEHKAERMGKATEAGMRWPSDRYAIAKNCMGCHSLANPDLIPIALNIDLCDPTL